jgi:signal transduction histidine kinase
MQEKISEIIFWTILSSALTILPFILFINYIITLYNKKNIEFNTQLQLRSLEKEKEILKTRVDVQEETIQKISKELHDNVNQILTLAKLNLNNINRAIDHEKINVSQELITNAINELSNLSNSLSSQQVKDFGLIRSLEIECQRIMKIKNIELFIESDISDIKLSIEDQVILYRIFQEGTRNSIIHGQANFINIKFFQTDDFEFIFEISDNGFGFSQNNKDFLEKNIIGTHQGIKNMQRRSSILNASFSIESKVNIGTTISIRKLRSNQ